MTFNTEQRKTKEDRGEVLWFFFDSFFFLFFYFSFSFFFSLRGDRPPEWALETQSVGEFGDKLSWWEVFEKTVAPNFINTRPTGHTVYGISLHTGGVRTIIAFPVTEPPATHLVERSTINEPPLATAAGKSPLPKKPATGIHSSRCTVFLRKGRNWILNLGGIVFRNEDSIWDLLTS